MREMRSQVTNKRVMCSKTREPWNIGCENEKYFDFDSNRINNILDSDKHQ